MTQKELKTAGEVIDALGGTAGAARFLGLQDQHVSNYRASGKLPAKTFLIISTELDRRGLTASPSLWGMLESEQGAA